MKKSASAEIRLDEPTIHNRRVSFYRCPESTRHNVQKSIFPFNNSTTFFILQKNGPGKYRFGSYPMEQHVKIVIATSNNHKIREIADKMSDLTAFSFIPMNEACPPMEIIEDGSTFAENALIKARAVLAASGIPSLADDSGLAVDALNGEPGIFSARYGNLPDDRSRYERVLSLMETVPDGKRSARFVCAMALALPDGREFVAEGKCEGSIARGPEGTHGFGYDPVFIVGQGPLTMAQIPLEEKNRISHRALALDKLREILSSLKDGEIQ